MNAARLSSGSWRVHSTNVAALKRAKAAREPKSHASCTTAQRSTANPSASARAA